MVNLDSGSRTDTFVSSVRSNPFCDCTRDLSWVNYTFALVFALSARLDNSAGKCIFVPRPHIKETVFCNSKIVSKITTSCRRKRFTFDEIQSWLPRHIAGRPRSADVGGFSMACVVVKIASSQTFIIKTGQEFCANVRFAK